MTSHDLQVPEKKELDSKVEKTEDSRTYVPLTDIHETENALFITTEIPGVSKENLDIHLEKDVLTLTGKIDFSNYENFKPIYTEFRVGNYSRSFTLSSKIDKAGISAKIEDGVLTLHLPKVKDKAPIKIAIQ
jgi:HSP20 family molecular chaperone IbpA